jgi:tetratricopeptide (TPR) repeat protein
VALGKEAVELHPFLHLSRMFYAQALECAGEIEAALEQYRLASVMFSGSMLQALEGRCLAKLGRLDEAYQILQTLETMRGSEYVDAYHMSLLQEALGNRDQAIRELERAAEENSATICFMDVDPKIDSLRGDPRFLKVRDRVFAYAAPALR